MESNSSGDRDPKRVSYQNKVVMNPLMVRPPSMGKRIYSYSNEGHDMNEENQLRARLNEIEVVRI
jgi:hypothetical protein